MEAYGDHENDRRAGPRSASVRAERGCDLREYKMNQPRLYTTSHATPRLTAPYSTAAMLPNVY